MKIGDKVRSRDGTSTLGTVVEVHPFNKELIFYRVKWDNIPGLLLYKKNEVIKLRTKKLKLNLP